MLKYESVSELVKAAEDRGTKISGIVLDDQAEAMECSTLELYEKMEIDLHVMWESAKTGAEEGQRSMSGLTGGEGFLMHEYVREKNGGLCGPFLGKAMAKALSVAGCNASMGRIVAAPTAGSCGVLPGCVLTLLEEGVVEEKDAVMAMFTAGAVGMVIANRASIAGAQGGCQAECGSAAAMAAALVEMMGGTPAQCADACAIAISSQMGLVCDPVAGLVEIPCIKRNVSSLMIAFSSADLALAGIGARIPADECLDAMREVGDALPASLKETAGGGLAATPTGRALKAQVFGNPK